MNTKRKLVCGVGVNDTTYTISPKVNGKQIACPFYTKWVAMLRRCYSKKELNKSPSYKGCYVSSDWLFFSKFKEWMESKDWKNKDIDKDLLVNGNKAYSDKTCIFVSKDINTLLLTNISSRGDYKLGVTKPRGCVKFRSVCRGIKKETVHLGYYDTEEEAHEAYKKFKYTIISIVALGESEPLKSALMSHVIPEY